MCFRCNSNRIKKEKSNHKGGKSPSEVSIYREIWNERPHRCNLTLRYLGGFYGTPLWFNCFAHILAKGRYPALKYDKDNIMLVHPDVHYDIDYGTRDTLIRKIGQEKYDYYMGLKLELLRKVNHE